MTISTHFSGVLRFQENIDAYDTAFSVNGDQVTMIPLTDNCRRVVQDSIYIENSLQEKRWLFGYAEDNCSVAILKNSRLIAGFTSGADMCAAKFGTPLIIKSTATGHISDLKTFGIIEFYGGIIDTLYPPALAITEDASGVTFRNKEDYTKTYPVEISGEQFKVQYTVSFDDLSMEMGKVPDYRNSVHSVMRFIFPTERSVDDFELYYSYGMRLFQFCAGYQNVWSEVRLYGCTNSRPMLIWLNDGCDDYANDRLDMSRVIRFQFLEDRLQNLLKLLNEKETEPRMLFLPQRNRDATTVKSTDVTDLCVAFEREYALLNDAAKEDLVAAADTLTERLLAEVKKTENCPELVKSKAISILSQLRSFSPSLREKISSICSQFRDAAKLITEQPDRDRLGIAVFYDEKAFNEKIKQFVALRNQASHASVSWNGGEDIIPHLKLYIYFSVLSRAGYTPEESSAMLSWMFTRFF